LTTTKQQEYDWQVPNIRDICAGIYDFIFAPHTRVVELLFVVRV
jgi:hypothetical protein